MLNRGRTKNPRRKPIRGENTYLRCRSIFHFFFFCRFSNIIQSIVIDIDASELHVRANGVARGGGTLHKKNFEIPSRLNAAHCYLTGIFARFPVLRVFYHGKWVCGVPYNIILTLIVL